MSRGFDGFEIDDFRGGDSRFDREATSGSSSSWHSRNARHNIWREEDRADRLDRENREHPDSERPPLPREERVHAILSQRIRTKYTDRNKEYSLRDSEIPQPGLSLRCSRCLPPRWLCHGNFGRWCIQRFADRRRRGFHGASPGGGQET